jgi:hypothetical protein
MIIQDWERERNMEDVYIMEKQFQDELEYWEWVNRKPAKIIIDDKIKRKPRAFRRASKKRIFPRHSIFANVY